MEGNKNYTNKKIRQKMGWRVDSLRKISKIDKLLAKLTKSREDTNKVTDEKGDITTDNNEVHTKKFTKITLFQKYREGSTYVNHWVFPYVN